jgi:hypothetical protein
MIPSRMMNFVFNEVSGLRKSFERFDWFPLILSTMAICKARQTAAPEAYNSSFVLTPGSCTSSQAAGVPTSIL